MSFVYGTWCGVSEPQMRELRDVFLGAVGRKVTDEEIRATLGKLSPMVRDEGAMFGWQEPMVKLEIVKYLRANPL